MENKLIEAPIEGEISRREDDDFSSGDFVTRNGDDIQFVLHCDNESLTVVCIVPNAKDYWVPGETEFNLKRRYSNINYHFLPFAKSEFERVKQNFPKEWFSIYEGLK